MKTPQNPPGLSPWTMIGGVVLILAVLLFFTSWNQGRIANFEQSQSGHETRIAEIERRLSAQVAADHSPVGTSTATDSSEPTDSASLDLPSLISRLESLEARFAQLAEAQNATDTHPAMDPKELIANRLKSFEEMIGQQPITDAAVERFAKESGRSQWGATAMEGVHWAYADAPFFNELGGKFSIDCRQSICKGEWDAPDVSGLDALEAEQQLSLAGYELLAVVAKGGPDIGPIHSMSTTDERGSRLTVYFSKEPTQ